MFFNFLREKSVFNIIGIFYIEKDSSAFNDK